MKFQKHPMILVIFLVIILVIVGITVYGKYIKNENLKRVLSYKKVPQNMTMNPVM